MSAGTGGRREVAHRLLAAEYEDADLSYSESDEERAPNYVLTPSGARVNRLFVVGVLTECERVSDDVLRARVVDPTGAFVLYAGQYQPDERAFLERADPPAFLAVTGKARTFQPEDSEVVYTSVRPESINAVDADTRDRWTVQAAEQTLARVGRAARALATGLHGEDLRASLQAEGVDPATAAGIALALDHYGTTPAYLDALRDLALDSVRVVADQRSEVRGFDVEPDDSGEVTVSDLLARLPEDTRDVDESDVDVEDPATAETAGTVAEQSATETVEPVSATEAARGNDIETGDQSAADAEAGESTEEGGDATTTSPLEGADQAATGDQSATGDESADDSGAGQPSGDDEHDPADFDPDSFDLDDDVREEVESEYGTEFQTGTEVDEPGEADIETPEPDTPEADTETAAGTEAEAAEANSQSVETTAPETAAPGPDAGDGSSGVTAVSEESEDTAPTPSAGTGADGSDSTPEAADADGETGGQQALLAVMRELDDGTGADRAAVVTAMVDRHDLSESEVGDLIEDALMDGQCYEPDESTIQPI